MSIVQMYAPTNDASDEMKEAFKVQLQSILESNPKHDMLFVIGDFKATVNNNNDELEDVMEKMVQEQ